MLPVRLNRRRFLGCSAAAGFALTQGNTEASHLPIAPVRIGLVGAGNRGTALLRSLLELSGTEIVAIVDPAERHAMRASGIVEKAHARRPDRVETLDHLLDRTDLDAILMAVPCDLHADFYRRSIQAGKHIYAEKPLALTLNGCDSIIGDSLRHPEVVVHVGHQRRSNSKLKACVDLVRSGELGELIEARVSWTSSNGPIQGHLGWLGQRGRSGDWMVEQAVHIWDLLHWITDELPDHAIGVGRRDVFRATDPGRDVTDWYQVNLDWPSGFHASMTHSWIDPADDAFTGISQKLLGTKGGLDLARGILTYRDKSRPRKVLQQEPTSDTTEAIFHFLSAVRHRQADSPPVSLKEAREAVATGLMVRRAVDERRLVTRIGSVESGQANSPDEGLA